MKDTSQVSWSACLKRLDVKDDMLPLGGHLQAGSVHMLAADAAASHGLTLLWSTQGERDSRCPEDHLQGLCANDDMLQLGRNPQVSGVHILPAKEGPIALLQHIQAALSMCTT